MGSTDSQFCYSFSSFELTTLEHSLYILWDMNLRRVKQQELISTWKLRQNIVQIV